MRFEYPLKEITDENVENHLGSSNQFGFYPIGRLNSWHGGLHLEGAGNEIRAIADGKIIAYRMPKKYLEEVIKDKKSFYSNGMVLIRHEYKSPKEQLLTFYSLYVHLLPHENMLEEKLNIPEVFTKGGKKVDGLRARFESNKNEYFVIPKGAKVELDGEDPAEHWSRTSTLYNKVRYIDTNGIVHTGIYVANADRYVTKAGNSLTIKTSEDKGLNAEAGYFHMKDGDFDKLVACDLPVKAGAILGYSGKYGFEKQPDYMAVHVEVFTPDDVVPFLKDAKNDGETEKNYLRIKQGAVLRKAFPGKLPGGGTIKVISEEENYSKVQLDTVTKIVLHEDLNYKGKKSEIDFYHPKTGAAFTRINSLFGGILKTDSVLLLEEKIDEGAVKKRKVTFNAGVSSKPYWIPSGFVRSGEGDIRNLSNDVPQIYEEKPDLNHLEEELPKEILVKKNKFKTQKDAEGKTWFEVVAENKKGWIKEDDAGLQLLSAYNWEEFGFKVIRDTQDEYIYDAEAPPKFLNDVWGELDLDGNKVLTPLELRNAFRNKALVRKLSGMVCEHTSEWAYGLKWGQFKSKVEKLFEEGIKKEEDGERKQVLENQKKEVIDALEKRVKNLTWWNEVKQPPAQPEKKDEGLLPDRINAMLPDMVNEFGRDVVDMGRGISKWLADDENEAPAAIASPKKSPPKSPLVASGFPVGQPKVFHFHPIAFVEQMRRMGGDCCKIDEDYFFIKYDEEFPQSKLNSNKKEILKSLFQSINEYYKNEKKCCELKHIAYMLATAKHETANTFEPIGEYGSQRYFEEKYDPILGSTEKRRQKAIKYGNTEEGDGVKYKGRGYIQLTFKVNYLKMQNKFGINLVDTPDNANLPSLAVKIMIYGSENGTFTGVKLKDFINDNKVDYVNARKVINGLDQAETISNYAKKIEKCLKILK